MQVIIAVTLMHPAIPHGLVTFFEQGHEVGSQTLDRLHLMQVVQAGELAGGPDILEGERVISPSHPLGGRMVVTPGDFMTKHDFHGTRE